MKAETSKVICKIMFTFVKSKQPAMKIYIKIKVRTVEQFTS